MKNAQQFTSLRWFGLRPICCYFKTYSDVVPRGCATLSPISFSPGWCMPHSSHVCFFFIISILCCRTANCGASHLWCLISVIFYLPSNYVVFLGTLFWTTSTTHFMLFFQCKRYSSQIYKNKEWNYTFSAVPQKVLKFIGSETSFQREVTDCRGTRADRQTDTRGARSRCFSFYTEPVKFS
jgi:hypothetical protein